MQHGTEIRRNIPYKQLGDHSRKCPVCSELIQEGELINIHSILKFTTHKQKGYHPVKGHAVFIVYHFYHTGCDKK